MKKAVLPSLLLLIPLFGYCEDFSSPTPVQDIGALSPTSVNPQDAAVQNPANSPQMLINPSYGYTISNQPVNRAGIYSLGGQMLIDRSVLLSGSLTVSSATISSATVTTKLSVPNGVSTTDVAAFGQLVVFQVIKATSATNFTTTSNTFQATGSTATITPTSASHRVLIIVSSVESMPATAFMYTTIERGSTNIAATSFGETISSTGGPVVPVTIAYIDSPASTSALTYQVFIRNSDNAGSVSFGRGNVTTTWVVAEIL